jgi:hypothetical protein
LIGLTRPVDILQRGRSPFRSRPTSGFSRRHSGVTRQSYTPPRVGLTRVEACSTNGRNLSKPVLVRFQVRTPGRTLGSLCPRAAGNFRACMGSLTPVFPRERDALTLSYNGLRFLRRCFPATVRRGFPPSNAEHPLCFALLHATPPNFGIRFGRLPGPDHSGSDLTPPRTPGPARRPRTLMLGL